MIVWCQPLHQMVWSSWWWQTLRKTCGLQCQNGAMPLGKPRPADKPRWSLPRGDKKGTKHAHVGFDNGAITGDS